VDKKNIVLAIIGILCSAVAVYFMGASSDPVGQIAGLIIALFFGLFAGICFAYIIAPKIGSAFGCFVYTPLEYLKNPAEKISLIRGLIEQEKYQEAIDALNEILSRKQYDPLPYLLLVELYMDRLNDKNQAAKLIGKYFQNRKPSQKIMGSPENVELLMRYSDICIEQNRLQAAISLFQEELASKEYSEPEKRILTLRLEALIIREK
jgi:tetratricopeptide (TPR) repeat protein